MTAATTAEVRSSYGQPTSCALKAEADGDHVGDVQGFRHGRHRRCQKHKSDSSRLQPGDEVVCPFASPVQSALFPSVGALVTDAGRTLSHSPTIAREYRVPAVIACGDAPGALRDGIEVTVDGDAGTAE